MNKRIKATWVRALRSGKYQQGKGVLREKKTDLGVDMFCCLGVLCEVLVKSRSVHKPDIQVVLQNNEVPRIAKYLYDNDGESLSGQILEYTEISEDLEGMLIRMNDSGKSFTQIANWIEANL